ncbi:ArsR/SmtB family transcription factor [Deinococcus roseus]|uniref:Transcriptional regulator n=1 Tax=Deinococcus roseus TaxID=392414 RepID=A0ABQ2DCR6_9DEIO|nr:metalloregulator ArsR/SmtB family transcription factor [Deinococcus roseus]GGJ52543.1 transcriptional regulator [Deinococcus roseus]
MEPELHQYKAEFFKTLGHPLRLAILDQLRKGSQTVTELQNQLHVDQSSLSQQLSKLRQQNFIHARKDGTTVHYQVEDRDIYTFLDLARSIYQRQIHRSSQILQHLQQSMASREEP